MKKRYFQNNYASIEQLKRDFYKYATNEELDYQETEDEKGNYICQFKKTKGFTSRAVTVILTKYSDDLVEVSIGQAKWATKATGGLIAILASGPLALIFGVTSAISAIGQAKLIKEVTKLVTIRLTEK